ncbi:MAG: YjbH domain-containing protein, partial [Bacteroidota bacterium]|nr:YjbH domain-containing protein [Bacteroidota bacterium]
FSLMFLPFFEASATLIRPYDQWWGIGDRSYKVRFLLMKEKKYMPALALGIHDPISSNTRQGAVYFVGSKKFNFKKDWYVDTHLGYGFDIQNEIWEKTKLFRDDSNNNQTHLTGIFTGFSIAYKNFGFLAEYDTEKINAGISVFIWKYFYAQISTLGFDAISFGLSARYRLGDKFIKG